MQFQEKFILKENWWLMWCSFPNLNWARLRTYDDLSSEILDVMVLNTHFLMKKKHVTF